MDYQIWTKDEYQDTWNRQVAGDKGAAKRIILDELAKGHEPILTIEVPFDLQLNVGEPGGEVKKPSGKRTKQAQEELDEEARLEVLFDKTKQDKNPGE